LYECSKTFVKKKEKKKSVPGIRLGLHLRELKVYALFGRALVKLGVGVLRQTPELTPPIHPLVRANNPPELYHLNKSLSAFP